jgi:hypothetical protein
LLGLAVLLAASPAAAWVALMAGQSARPLQGRFNGTPTLHSNQPEEVVGPGILISTAPGFGYAAETGQAVRNATYTFQGAFGMHLHHKYFPPYRASISPGQRRTELTLAAILINPNNRPVRIRFEAGAVRNSFEAPYLANHLLGVKPLGPRPWNTGPGDATAVQMLRGNLDRQLASEVTIPGRSRIVLFHTQLPALGIANALLRGRSDGPFHIAVVAARNPDSDADILAVLDQGWLAPGRVYLPRTGEIQQRVVFSRVGGVAVGDAYRARIRHDLQARGPLHVPFTSTVRTNFGTGDVQVNPLASRMEDSALDNVGTYGVRFDIDLDLWGGGPHELVMSHPAPIGGEPFIAFRGSLQITTPDGQRDVHVGLRSGESLSLAPLHLRPGVSNPVRVSMVYPADATPGHLLSVVPSAQLARLREQERQRQLARLNRARPNVPPAAPPPLPAGGAQSTPQPLVPGGLLPPPPPPHRPPHLPQRGTPQPVTLRGADPVAVGGDLLIERYRQAVEAQQRLLRSREAP